MELNESERYTVIWKLEEEKKLNATKFAIFLEYKKPFSFSFRATLFLRYLCQPRPEDSLGENVK